MVEGRHVERENPWLGESGVENGEGDHRRNKNQGAPNGHLPMVLFGRPSYLCLTDCYGTLLPRRMIGTFGNRSWLLHV